MRFIISSSSFVSAISSRLAASSFLFAASLSPRCLKVLFHHSFSPYLLIDAFPFPCLSLSRSCIEFGAMFCASAKTAASWEADMSACPSSIKCVMRQKSPCRFYNCPALTMTTRSFAGTESSFLSIPRA
ncbi:hypothetical protein PILCRDRAFT_644860 [Piloderma croceum F 1598]|uniref:Uncharacterized protein n=1 Tax=Piloderma croceum (strain F 1598) TaxID=765440 RepID=A0A0C3BGM2_PILCF|nr:hypothetical protein PILCRDRAFT_644860 [Piloderma croceum F 1598]